MLSVSGHAGKLVFGELGSKKVVCMQGRVHLYEGYEPWKVNWNDLFIKKFLTQVLIRLNNFVHWK